MNIYRKPTLGGITWNQLKSENIETLCPLSALEVPVEIDYKKACCYGTSMNIDILLVNLWKISLTHGYNQRFSDVFKGHRKRAAPWNELKVM